MAPTKREPSPEDNGKAKVPKYYDKVKNIVKDDRKQSQMELKTGSLMDYPLSWRQGLRISLTAEASLSTRKALTFTPAPREPS